MVDVNTIIGNLIVAADGTTVIGLRCRSASARAAASSHPSTRGKRVSALAFGGGSGAGVTVSPVCFLVIGKDGSANILGINAQASDTVDRLVEMIPGAINKVSNFVSGFKGKTEDAAEVAETLSGDE